MQRMTTTRRLGVRVLLAAALVVAGVFSGRALTQEASAGVASSVEVAPASVENGSAAPGSPPPRPTIEAHRAWEAIEADLACSPWLRNADEFAAWVDTTGNQCQEYTALVAEKLRELDYLLNEHWIGRRATQVLLAGAGTVAAVVPEPGVTAGAGALVFVVKTSPQWTEALAVRVESLGEWIEEATEVWEDYAQAYQLASESPSAEHISAWMDAAAALRPYLERGQELVTTLNEHLATIDGHLSDLSDYLEGVDHWTVSWLADETGQHVVDPALAVVRDVRPVLQMTQGRMMIDRALITTMPLRFSHIEIVDAPSHAE